MSLEITPEQIKSLNNDYLRNLDLSTPEALIFGFYGVEGKQASELYQTATQTQEHLLASVGAITALLRHFLSEPSPTPHHKLELVKIALMALPDIVELIKGINHTILNLSDEAKRFDHNKP